MKQCTKCKKVKPAIDFNLCKIVKSGLQSWCKECQRANGRGWHRRKIKAMGDKAADYRRNIKLKFYYGMSLEQYKKRLADQGNVCAICGNPETTMHQGSIKPMSVDHCHKTNKVRGLLCSKCNSAIAFFSDDIDLLASATSYLLNEGI